MKETSSITSKKKNSIKGMIPIFKSRYRKWSYVKIDKDGFEKEVQEGVDPSISDNATAAGSIRQRKGFLIN